MNVRKEKDFLDLSEQKQSMCADMAIRMFENNVSVAEMYGLTIEECEAIYTRGHQLYSQGDYHTSSKYFRWLIANVSGHDSRYYRALGASQSMLGRWVEAVTSYGAAIINNQEDAVTPLDMAECLLLAHQWERASKALDMYRDAYSELAAKEPSLRERYLALREEFDKKCPASRNNKDRNVGKTKDEI